MLHFYSRLNPGVAFIIQVKLGMESVVSVSIKNDELCISLNVYNYPVGISNTGICEGNLYI